MFDIVIPLLFSSEYDDCVLEFIRISLIEMRSFRYCGLLHHPLVNKDLFNIVEEG